MFFVWFPRVPCLFMMFHFFIKFRFPFFLTFPLVSLLIFYVFPSLCFLICFSFSFSFHFSSMFSIFPSHHLVYLFSSFFWDKVGLRAPTTSRCSTTKKCQTSNKCVWPFFPVSLSRRLDQQSQLLKTDRVAPGSAARPPGLEICHCACSPVTLMFGVDCTSSADKKVNMHTRCLD